MSLTKATFNMIDGAYVNVLDYGADPTGTEDSSTAIQAAIDSTIDNLKTVYIPSGTYLINTMLGFVHSARITMERGAILSYSGPDACIWVRDEGGSIGGEGFIIEGGQIQGGGAEGIRLGRTTTISPAVGTVRDVYVSGMSIGFNVISGQILNIRDCQAQACGIGIFFTHTAGLFHTTVEVDSCRFTENTFQGGYVKQGWQITFKHCQFEINGKEGLKILRDNETSGIHQMIIKECWFEANNYNRTGIGYGQLEITNSVAGTIDFVKISDSNFAIPGTDNHQILISGNISPIILDNNRYVDTVGNTAHGSISGGLSTQKIFCTGKENYTDWTLDTNALSAFDIGSIVTAKSSELVFGGGSQTSLVEYFPRAATLISATFVYNVATSSGLGATVATIGKRTDSSYYGSRALTSLAPIWTINNVTLLNRDVAATDVVTLSIPSTTGTTGSMSCFIEYWIN